MRPRSSKSTQRSRIGTAFWPEALFQRPPVVNRQQYDLTDDDRFLIDTDLQDISREPATCC